MLARNLPISLVVPFKGTLNDLRPLLFALKDGTFWPNEILIVDAGPYLNKYKDEFSSFIDTFPKEFNNLLRIISPGKPLFPGEARNQGCLEAKNPWIAFIDVNTIPTLDWLEISFNAAEKSNSKVALGTTTYFGNNFLERIFVRATYGEQALPTLPGTLIYRSILLKTGLFLPKIRAGEDTDWLVRMHQFGHGEFNAYSPSLSYRAVPKNLFDLARKWYRNYSSCSPVVFHLETQKSIYLITANLFVILVTFKWNALIAGWNESNVLYVAHITKIALSMLILSYCLLRGLIMPLRKGSKAEILLPFQWIIITCICFILDIVKLIAFVRAFFRRSKQSKFKS